MKELQIFSYKAMEIRVIMIQGEPWWILKDACDVLNLSDTNKVAERLDEDELTRVKFVSGGQTREMYAVNEAGLYNVILRSEKPEAKQFKRWLTHEALPSIRKTGTYSMSKKKLADSEASQKRAETMERNSHVKAAELWLKIAETVSQSDTYRQICASYASKELAGEHAIPLPEAGEHYYSATEMGEMLGVSKNKIGQLANANGLKIDEYGKWFHDKSRYSAKEVDNFRYNRKAIERFRELLAN